jgi:hypothetical protein
MIIQSKGDHVRKIVFMPAAFSAELAYPAASEMSRNVGISTHQLFSSRLA